MKGKLIFSTIVFPRKTSETDALLLVESIRAFAGTLSKVPIWCFTPGDREQLSTTFKERLQALYVTLVPFNIDYETLQFPFTGQVHAAALAESMASYKTDFLAWSNANSMVLQEPKDFLLQDGKSLGFRPVHHILVGSHYEAPLDPFWTLIYCYCNVSEERVFPMTTHVDGAIIRPYFNAGLLVTRPERRLFKAWRDNFFKYYREPPFQELYRQDERYMIFIHQAMLSGVILSTLGTDEIQELPPTYNYPLHLHAEDVTDNRPSCLEELVTIRHEGFYKDTDWIKKLPAKESLKQWIIKRLI